MKTEIIWKNDDSGRVIGANIHDGQVVEYEFSSNKNNFHLGVRSLSGDLIRIELSGLREIRVDLFMGPIVSDVYTWTVDAAPTHTWEIPDSAWNVLFSSQMKLENAKKAAEKIIRDNPKSILIQVECSYGGAIAAVCDQVTIHK